MKTNIIVLLLGLLTIAASQEACAVDEDCRQGFECREFVECNDFGCQNPNFQCWPADNQPTNLGAGATTIAQVAQPPRDPIQARIQQDAEDNAEAPAAPAEEDAIPADPAPAAAPEAPALGPSRLIIRTRNNENSILRLDSSNNDFSYSFQMNPQDRRFDLMRGPNSVMRFSDDGKEIQGGEDVVIRADGLEIQDMWRFRDTQLQYNGVPQWKLVHDELFRVGQLAEGWSLPDSVTQGGGVQMLGGYGATSNENLVKVFDNIPPHTRIKIESNFHFLDSWGGETAFLRVSDNDDLGTLNYIWTDSYDYVSARNAVNVGGRDIGDGKFNTFISFEMMHSFDQLRVQFGTSLEQKAGAASYGISTFRIYII